MRMLALSLCFCAFSTNLLGQEEPAGVRQSWSAPAALAVALSANETLAKARSISGTPPALDNIDESESGCVLSALRPTGPEKFASAKNTLNCTLSDGGEGTAHYTYDIRTAAFENWGHQYDEAYWTKNGYSRVFQLHNEAFNQPLYETLASLYKAKYPQATTMHLCDNVSGTMCIDTYSLESTNGSEIPYLSCSVDTEAGKIYKTRCIFYFPEERTPQIPQEATADTIQDYPGVRLGAKTERAIWNAEDNASSLAIANVLREAASNDPNLTQIKLSNIDPAVPFQYARCSGSVLRPGRGEGPIVDNENIIICETRSHQNSPGTITLDLSEEPLHRFGDTFTNFGVKIRGAIADGLYAAAAKISQERSDENYLLTEEIANFGVDKNVGWRFRDYHVAWDSHQGKPSASPSIFECGQDENYSLDTQQAIPGTNSGTHCVFFYHRRGL